LRDRAPFRLFGDGVKALLPAAVAITLMALGTLSRAGALPDFGTYLKVHSTYNMLAEPWAVVANPMFLGWMAMLLSTFVILSDAWMVVLSPLAHATGVDDEVLFYRFVAMTMLLIVQGSYFVGRSIEATLDLAILPFCAVAIPAALAGVAAIATEKWP